MKTTNIISIVVRISHENDRVRVSKLINLILSHNINIEIIGLDRSSINSDTSNLKWIGISTRRETNSSKKLSILNWVINLFRYLLSSKSNNERLFLCVGFESAFVFWLVNIFARNHRFIFDNSDNISELYNFNYFSKKIISFIERNVALSSEVHIVPGRSRWKHDDINLKIVSNRPLKNDLLEARKFAHNSGFHREIRCNKIVIYVNGWLVESRGISTLLESMKIIQSIAPGSVHLIVAGRLGCDSAINLIKMDNVEYLGVISNRESLAQYFRCHLAFTFYDPVIPINQIAEPNKWGDCIATHTPFLTNRGIKTAKYFFDNGLCLILSYNDPQALANKILELTETSKWYDLYNSYKNVPPEYWDESMWSAIFSDKYSSIINH
jgi:glycosyltransferase involved in cell wall biosynthesis